jgi:lysyl-tRNA synthetase class 2
MVDDFKLKKLDAMKNVGINPYPYSFERTHTASQVHAGFEKLEGKAVVVAGRIIGMRKMGSLNFLDLLDWSGKIQVILKKMRMEEHCSLKCSILEI